MKNVEGKMIEKIGMIILVAELTVLGIEDIRYRKVSVKLLIIMLVVGVVFKVAEAINGGVLPCFTIIGILFGVGLSVAGYFSKAIGTGDGLVVIIMTLMTGGITAMIIFLIAITLAGGVAAVLLISKRVKRHYELPLIPFLWVSLIIVGTVSNLQTGL